MPKSILQIKWQSLSSRLRNQEYCHNNKDRNKKRLFLISALVFSGLLLYLWQINSLATKGYQIRTLQNKVSELKSTNKKIQVEITDLRSDTRISAKVKELNMVAVARVVYLQANGSSVALNR